MNVTTELQKAREIKKGHVVKVRFTKPSGKIVAQWRRVYAVWLSKKHNKLWRVRIWLDNEGTFIDVKGKALQYVRFKENGGAERYPVFTLRVIKT